MLVCSFIYDPACKTAHATPGQLNIKNLCIQLWFAIIVIVKLKQSLCLD